MIFHEIYSSYYQTAAAVLKEAVHGTLTGKRLNELIQEYAFEESLLTIPEGLKGEKWKLLHKDFTTPLKKEPSMPLTDLEKRWMKTLLSDPRINLFRPDVAGLENADPLFTPDMITYYDRNADGDDYTDPDYIRHFSVILQALCEGRNLFVNFESRVHAGVKILVTPYYLEYSRKDDRFRLIAAGKDRRWTINLSRIQTCRLASDERICCDNPSDMLSGRTVPCCDDRIQLREPTLDTVTLELEDRRNALERVLLHFSHLEKETKRLDRTHYRVILKYERSDETEMVIRILSFGPVVKVTGPDRMADLIRERVQKQRVYCKENDHSADREGS